MADPGFPDEGVNPLVWAKTNYLAIFLRKLHENERNWTEVCVWGGGTKDSPRIRHGDNMEWKRTAELYFIM